MEPRKTKQKSTLTCFTQSDTKEARRGRLQKAEQLERKFIEENNDAWEKRTEEVSKRIEKEENETRLEMVEMMKKKYGKAGNKKLTSEEDGMIGKETETKLEIAEIRQNL